MTENEQARTIRTLSQSMINKIAAGEVIERPASVVKELVENAIDAGATRIDVAVDQGGADLIRVVDNGCGIATDQLVLALSPHSTSKIAEADDLFRILTFGFRGEALASIAEIAQMSIRSRMPANNEGAEIRSDGGERTESVPCGMPPGTQIEVRNLFFNTPVRRNYMKSTTTEFGHVAETFVRLVLPQPKIHFTLKHNGRVVHDLPPESSMLARIRQIFGEDIAKNLIEVESRSGSPVRVHGFVSHPNQSRGNNRMQYFFLNGRFIRDRALQHALNEAYRGLLTVGRFPLAFLEVELAPNQFDVNVHPTKMEVRFLDSNRVYSGFLATIREKFLTTDLHGRFALGSKDSGLSAGSDFTAPNDPRGALDDSVAKETRQAVMDWVDHLDKTVQAPPPQRPLDQPDARQSASVPAGSNVTEDNVTMGHATGAGTTSNLSLHRLPDRPSSSTSSGSLPRTNQGSRISSTYRTETSTGSSDVDTKATFEPTLSGQSPPSDRVAYSPQGKLVVQMHDRYLVMETRQGIAVIDQHALHERILYEKLKSRMSEGKLESQRLLVPIPVDLAPNELACVLENIDFFATLGLHVEPFGGETVLISSFPAILSKTPPQEILISLIEPILEAGKKLDRSELLEEMLHGMACKAAVKAGDKLHGDSIARLIELAEQEINAHHCPHGRPSMVVFTREELDKMFKR